MDRDEQMSNNVLELNNYIALCLSRYCSEYKKDDDFFKKNFKEILHTYFGHAGNVVKDIALREGKK